MTIESLQSNRAALRQLYRETPAAARVTLRAQGCTNDDITWHLESDKPRTVFGLHAGVGGSGQEACPGDMLLDALAACAGLTLKAVAVSAGLELRNVAVKAEGDLDFRSLVGLASDVPIGFQNIRVEFTLDTSATDEQLDALMLRTKTFCVVSRALAAPPVFAYSRQQVSA